MNIDPQGLPMMSLSILYGLVIVGGIVVIVTALRQIPVGHSDSVRDLFKQTRFLELTTVLAIIISATYLGLLGMLKSEGIAAILSGIAGYVLGGLTALKKRDSKPQTPDSKVAKT